MANRTVKEAKNIHGTNPQYLVEKIIRSRIYDSKYWKEQCFALTAELLVDKAMELRFIGGVYGGNIKPTQFLCLTLKMLQIQPEKDIVVEFIKNEEFKYVRALGAFYLRLTGTAIDCYKYLEPLYIDNRKLRRQNRNGHFEIVYMDDFIDELLRSDRVCDIILPRIQKRSILEENNEVEPKLSLLDEDLDEDVVSDDENTTACSNEDTRRKHNKKSRKRRSRSRLPSCSREYRSHEDNYVYDYNVDLERYQRERERDKERHTTSITNSATSRSHYHHYYDDQRSDGSYRHESRRKERSVDNVRHSRDDYRDNNSNRYELNKDTRGSDTRERDRYDRRY